MSDDKTKKTDTKEQFEMEKKALEEKLKAEEAFQNLTDRELELLKRLDKKAKKEKDPKPKKNPIGAALLYAKKGGMVRKSKVAGRLAKRGYGRAMKGKK
jgi:hypothetical protein